MMTENVIAEVGAPVAGAPDANAPDAPVMAAAGLRVSARDRLARWTIADGLFLVVGLLGGVLRFASLGGQPLSSAEAQAALGSWQLWHTTPHSAAILSPAYFSLTNLLLPVLGDSDAVMRLIPAVFGLGTVLLPWLLIRRWSAAGALAAGLLLAVSPQCVSVSRTAGGASIALFALLLLVVSGVRLAEGGRRFAVLLGAALGLGLTSSPLFYGGLATLAAAWWWVARQESPLLPRLSDHRQTILLTAGVTLFALSTSFLFYPAGLGASLRLMTDWLGQFGLPLAGDVTAQELLSPLLALLRYELLLVVLGLPALLWAGQSRDAAAESLIIWLSGLLVLVLFQPGVTSNALLFLLPGYLLIGLAIGRLSAQPRDEAYRWLVWSVAGGLALLGSMLLVSTARFARLATATADQRLYLALALSAAFAAGLLVLMAFLWNRTAALSGSLIGLGVLLLYLQWGTAWQLGHQGANDPRQLWIVEGTDDELPLMIDIIGRISRQAVNSEFDLDIFSQVDTPALRWYLRDFNRAQFGQTLPIGAANAVVITPIGTEPHLASDYFGADFGLRRWEVEPPAPPTWIERLRWWFFNESTAPVNEERVVMWVRADLAAP